MAGTADSATSPPARALVVDDEAHVRQILERTLQQLGHEVTTVEGPEAAVRALNAQAFDLVLAGGDLPADGGEELRAAMAAAEPEVIFVARVHSFQSAVDASRIGASDFLEKPITHLWFVREKIRRALERRWLRRENARLVDRVRRLTDEVARLRRRTS